MLYASIIITNMPPNISIIMHHLYQGPQPLTTARRARSQSATEH